MNPFKTKKGLGRGLSSLIGDTSSQPKNNKISISSIVRNKYQPRKNFNKENLDEASDEDMKGIVNDMLAAFKHQQGMVNEPARNYRRQLTDTGEVFKNLNPGDIVSDPGFLSTSRSDTWAVDEVEHPSIIMDIYGGKDT